MRIDRKYKLEKWPGKGGWTYAAIPEIVQNPENPFGWVTVKGRIDQVDFVRTRLMPMGSGKLFFPVKAALRKKIGKTAGDWVHIVLEPDDSNFTIPEVISSCLEDNPVEKQRFSALPAADQEKLCKWIYAVRTQASRESRIIQTLSGLLSNRPVKDIINSKRKEHEDRGHN